MTTTDPTPQPVTHASGPGAGMPLVAGRCPACRGASLYLGAGGHVTCARESCPDPTAADDLLHGGPPEPVVVLEDALCRRMWAAAMRWVHDRIRQPDYSELAAGTVEDWAGWVESGQLTPWADQPDPTATPARPAGDATAAAGPTPGQADLASGGAAQSEPAVSLAPAPTGPAILGRALLVRGELWPDAGRGRWRLPAGESSYDVEWVRSNVGPVREVLLVDPSVARVLDAARAVLRVTKLTPHAVTLTGHWGDAIRALAAAVDALPDAGTDTPTTTGEASEQAGPGVEQDTGADSQRRCPVEHPRHSQCELYAGHLADPRRDRHSSGGMLWLTEAEIRASGAPPLTSFAGALAEPAPEPDRLDALAKQVAAILADPVAGEGPRLSEVQAAARAAGGQLVVDVEPDPDLQSGSANASGQPAGLPGWDRATIGALAAGLAGESVAAELISPERGQALRDQVLALLADRDRLSGELERQRDTARAELAEATAERDRWVKVADGATRAHDAARTELETAWNAAGDMAAKEEQAARDRAALEAVKAELATARRDAAVLDAAAHSVWLHAKWRWLTSQMTTKEREAWADAVDRASAQLNADDPDLNAAPVDRWWRAGTRPAPGSPEPAHDQLAGWEREILRERERADQPPAPDAAHSTAGDWLGEEFARADDALGRLPGWAQPIVTRPVAEAAGTHPGTLEPDGGGDDG